MASKKDEHIPLSVVRKMPYRFLKRMLDKMRKRLKEDEVVQNMFKEYNLDIEEIDYIPMAFKTLDVSAKCDHAVIYFNWKLLCDGNFTKDWSYAVHEMTHFCQQTTGNVPTQGADDGSYLDNPAEQEGFQNQVEYIANHEGEGEAKKYVENLLDHHDIQEEEKKDELEAILLKEV